VPVFVPVDVCSWQILLQNSVEDGREQ
jgi:hypothetical protein